MARVPAFDKPESDLSLKDLGTLLTRLRGTLSEEYAANVTPYTLQKFKANFEFARALLLRLEHESASIKVASTKQAIQSDLRSKRAQIKELQSHIQQLDTFLHEDDDDDDESIDEQDTDEEQDRLLNESNIPDTSNDAPVEPTVAHEQAAAIASTLRSRKPGRDDLFAQTKSTSKATGVQVTPFANGSNNGNNNNSNDNDVRTKEQLLDHDRAEQDQITASLLALARELKASQQTLGGLVADERADLGNVAEAMDRNAGGMQSAGQRMGMLRRMTEGKGFLGRLWLYGYIAVLWLVAFVVVFVLPKLRF